jgi:WS/DGAT/MGAT family acyltransferase
MRQRPAAVIERAGPSDVMELVCDVTGTSMQVAAILVLEPQRQLELDAVRAAIAERITAVPRMRQRLIPAPVGCGRPVWVDDAAFDIHRHVTAVRNPFDGDPEHALLQCVAELVTRRLPTERPLWQATLIRGGGDAADALLVVFHHVLADGIGGLAMLAQLVDGVPPVAVPGFPRWPPTTRDLARECWRSRVSGLRRIADGLGRLRSAARELGSGAPPAHAARCSLNASVVGTRRALATAEADLDATRRAAHAAGGTVNDVLLAAVTGTLGRVLEHRGERVDHLVISVPVSARRRTGATELGNQVGVIPVDLPTTGDPSERLRSIARITAQRKTAAPGSSAAMIGPAFRVLARLGVFTWFIGRQRLINTFVTNMRGPQRRLRFTDAEVLRVIAVPMITGNVSVAFGALSYAGTLTLTVVADPDCCPDLPAIAAALQAELDQLIASARTDAPRPAETTTATRCPTDVDGALPR